MFKLSAAKKNSRSSSLERVARAELPYGRQEQARNACEFGMGAILNWAEDKENSSKNEQARSSIDHTFITDGFMLGEEDGLRDDFLDGVYSVGHIGAVARRQTRQACAR
ncbi:MAG: hypothetical protein JO012_12465 [Hyphomicrobiales bacterium]|nr:hypothetical protein [Hyphomicrobiales bacterium]